MKMFDMSTLWVHDVCFCWQSWHHLQSPDMTLRSSPTSSPCTRPSRVSHTLQNTSHAKYSSGNLQSMAHRTAEQQQDTLDTTFLPHSALCEYQIFVITSATSSRITLWDKETETWWCQVCERTAWYPLFLQKERTYQDRTHSLSCDLSELLSHADTHNSSLSSALWTENSVCLENLPVFFIKAGKWIVPSGLRRKQQKAEQASLLEQI